MKHELGISVQDDSDRLGNASRQHGLIGTRIEDEAEWTLAVDHDWRGNAPYSVETRRRCIEMLVFRRLFREHRWGRRQRNLAPVNGSEGQADQCHCGKELFHAPRTEPS